MGGPIMATSPDASNRTEDRLDAGSEHRIWRPVSRRTVLKLAPVTAAVVLGPAAGTALAAASAPGGLLNIVAHEDDDLLFLSPSLLHAIQGGGPIRTIFVTAGDAGSSSTYWNGRQNGIQAAYAQMAGVTNN